MSASQKTPLPPTLAMTMEKTNVTKTRAPEFYGFVAWVSTSTLFVVYILWALLPDKWIVALGVDWYPNREWSILVPAWSVVTIILTYIVYWSLALLGTPSPSDMSTVTDSFVHLPPPDSASSVYQASSDATSIPELYDIPIGMVNRVLYHKKAKHGS